MKSKETNSINEEKVTTCKRFGVKFLLIAAGVAVVIAGAVHFLSPRIPSLITADGMLSYIISCISAVATIYLAGVAYRQTERANTMAKELTEKSNHAAEKANELSERVTQLEEYRYKMEVRPYILITNWEVKKGKPAEFEDKKDVMSYQVGPYSADDGVSIILEAINTTPYFEIVQYSCAETITCERESPKWEFSVNNRNNLAIGIPAGEYKKICFNANRNFFSNFNGHAVKMQFILTNRFGDRFNESVELWITTLNWENEFCMIQPQNYKVQAYSKDHKLIPE